MKKKRRRETTRTRGGTGAESRSSVFHHAYGVRTPPSSFIIVFAKRETAERAPRV